MKNPNTPFTYDPNEIDFIKVQEKNRIKKRMEMLKSGVNPHTTSGSFSTSPYTRTVTPKSCRAEKLEVKNPLYEKSHKLKGKDRRFKFIPKCKRVEPKPIPKRITTKLSWLDESVEK